MAIEFFDRHNLKHLKERTEFILLSDVSNIRHLAHTLVNIFQFHPDFIDFYEGIFKSRKVPHYEDIITLYTIIIGTIAMVGTWISPIMGEEYKQWKKKKAEKKGDLNLVLDEFEYFIKAYALRQAYYFGKISSSEFIELKKYLFSKVIAESKEINKDYEEKIDSYWTEFNENHNILLKDELINELNEISKVVESEPKKITKAHYEPLSSYTVKGLGVSPGNSIGILKVIDGIEDLAKVKDKDVGYFKSNYAPDHVPALKKCIAAIGSPDCGGMTGHLAIVSRELGIPCVTLASRVKFGDGQVVFVDGSKGVIKFFLSKEEILKALNS